MSLRYQFFLLLACVGVGIAIVGTVGLDELHALPMQSSQNHISSRIRFADSFTKMAPVPVELVTDGWIGLFDGSTLFGWRADANNWSIDGGLLNNRVENSMLRTSSQFDDFELSVQYKCSEECEASLFLRTSPNPKDPRRDSYQVKIATRDSIAPIGSLIDRRNLKRVISVGRDEWRKLRIQCRGGAIRVFWDDQLINECDDPEPLGRGYIGLRCDTGKLQVKSLWLRPLGKTILFDPLNVEQWKSSSGNDFRAKVSGVGGNTAMKLTGGPGYLESKRRYQDFVLQLESKISPSGNSGVFFRCVPGGNMNGYESQIDNSTASDSIDRPANCGTGGLFRRKDARRVVAADDTWFAKTMVVEGPHVAVWVNGYQVTDWTDKRKPNPNPRRGLRTDSGTLMLQGHDTKTTAWFRKIGIRELNKRNRQ